MSDELFFIKGYAKGKGFNNLCKAVNYADKCHKNQKRDGGKPYITHPLRVCRMLINLGIDDEDTLCAAILHDVLEDCEVTYDDLVKEFNTDVANYVNICTKKKSNNNTYFKAVKQYWNTAIIKIADRIHNLSTMSNAWDDNKINNYLQNTEENYINLINYSIDNFTKYSCCFEILKTHLEDLIDNINYFLFKENPELKNSTDVYLIKTVVRGFNTEEKTLLFNSKEEAIKEYNSLPISLWEELAEKVKYVGFSNSNENSDSTAMFSKYIATTDNKYSVFVAIYEKKLI